MKESSPVTSLQPGTICAFFEHECFCLGLVQECRESTCSLLLSDASSLTLHTGRFVLISRDKYITRPAEENLPAFQRDIQTCLGGINLSALWSELSPQGQSYSLDALLTLAGLPAGDAMRFALYLSLRADPGHFHLKNGLYRVKSSEEYRQYQAEQALQQLDDTYYSEVSSWLHAYGIDPSSAQLSHKARRRLESELQAAQPGHLTIRLRSLLHSLFPGHTAEQHWLLLRFALGQADEFTHPLLARSNLPCLFPTEVMQAAANLAEYTPDPERLNLAELDMITIDADSTPDLDDALSLRPSEVGWELGIHISDVGYFVANAGLLDREARLRTSSLYLPGQDVHMLPEQVSCFKASLLQGEPRPALSLICRLSSELDILDWELRLTTIKVKRRCSYNEVDALLSSAASDRQCDEQPPAWLSVLQAITEKHWQERLSQGALPPDNEELTPSRQLVAECMVLYNRFLAQYAASHDLPVLYRHLEDKLPEFDPAETGQGIPPSILGPDPLPHRAMGLKVYAQATSPLRRYSDLINQRQVIACLAMQPLPYNRADLQELLPHLLQTRQALRQLTYRAEQHLCLLSLLSAGLNTELQALVRRAGHNHATFFLPAYNCRISATVSVRLKPGQPISIKVLKVNPDTAACTIEIV